MKKALSLLLCALAALCPFRVHAADVPETQAKAFVLYCPQSGELLASDNPDKRMKPASTTKLMTTLLTLEQAAKENDVVHLFLLSQEAGPIPFAVRKRLVEAGIRDLTNVILQETGPYMISSATFPSYFLKDSDAAIWAQAGLDLAVFGRIAAALNIRRRYVGEENRSHVTALYNREMQQRLPAMGIDCRIIPRLETKGEIISASTVRKAIQAGNLEAVRSMLPECTYRYFASSEGAAVAEAIRREKDVIHY